MRTMTCLQLGGACEGKGGAGGSTPTEYTGAGTLAGFDSQVALCLAPGRTVVCSR